MNEKKWLDWPILYRNLTSAILYRSMKEGFINSTEFDQLTNGCKCAHISYFLLHFSFLGHNNGP